MTIAQMIDKPASEHPFRTIVDFMEWRDGIQAYNEQFEQLTKGIYQAFGMEGMLEPKTE